MKIEGWYDDGDNFSKGEPPFDLEDADKLVIDFGEDAGGDRYKIIHPGDWEFDDWAELEEQLIDWWEHEYGEAI